MSKVELSDKKITNHFIIDNGYENEPHKLIDYIFRVVMPKYGYTVRESQIQMCKTLFDGLKDKKVTVCEAEVGTGKTLSFLVAAVCIKLYGDNNLPVTITTANTELQRNLSERDLPKLSVMLKRAGILTDTIVVCLRKGKEHYYCKHRADDYFEKIIKYPQKNGEIIKELKNIRKKQPFDLDKEDIRPFLKNKICVHKCGKFCENYKICYYADYINYSRNSKITFQITNHNQFIADLKAKNKGLSGSLQNYDYCIIDEAHKFKDAAQDVYGSELCENEIPDYLAKVKFSSRDKYTVAYKCIVKKMSEMNTQIFNSLKNKYKNDVTDEDTDVPVKLNRYEITCMVELMNLYSELYMYGNENFKPFYGFESKIFPYVNPDRYIYWLSVNENGLYILKCTPKNTGSILYNEVWSKDKHFALTSGTMSDGKNFDYFNKINGIDKLTESDVLTCKTQSPFDYESNTRLYIPENIPLPDNDNDKYINDVANSIKEIIKATNGHTAILFTSYKLLRCVSEKVIPKLDEYNVFIMSKRNKNAIKDFKSSKNGILFASGSMWEGVDCIGDVLSSVIIVRLPFPIRTDVNEIYRENYKDLASFINEYALPDMIIKLKQGVGRLIRCEEDTGLISILDKRAICSSYSPIIKNVMNKYPIVDSLDEISEFFHSVKDEKYFDN